MKLVRKRLTYANVVSTLVLFLVIAGGTAFAAAKLGKNTVGTKQLKNNAVTTAKIKNGAVTGAKVNVSSLGTVPSATNATNAKSAEAAKTATSAKTAETAKSADSAKTANSALTSTDSVNAVNAKNADSLGGAPASEYTKRMFARIEYTTATPSVTAGSPGIVANSEAGTGFPLVSFPQSMDGCAIVGTANSGGGTQIVRRSSISSGSTVEFAIKNEKDESIRSSFELIAVC